MESKKGRKSMLPSFFNEEELKVADILVDLENLMKPSTHHPLYEFSNWTIKKSRSYKRAAPTSSPKTTLSPCQHPDDAINKVEVDKVEASSPAIPAQNHHPKPRQLSTKREVERGRRLRIQLQAHNLKLMAVKQKVMLKKYEEIKNMSISSSFASMSERQYLLQYHHHENGELFASSKSAQSPSSSSSSAAALRQFIEPRGIPDLNVSAEDPKERGLIRKNIMTKKKNDQRFK